MVRLLRQAWNRRALGRITRPGQVDEVLDSVMCKPWVVFAKPTSQHTDGVLSYLARYTYRIAISDRRLIGMDEQGVTFRWKDYRTGSKQRTMLLAGEEFVRRWLLHVLPHGLMRIRHYGYMANCHRRRKLAQIRCCLAHPSAVGTNESGSAAPSVRPDTIQRSYCPICHKACLKVVGEIERRRRQM